MDLRQEQSCSWLEVLDEDVWHESEVDICLKEVPLIESISQASGMILLCLKVDIYLHGVRDSFLVDIR